MHIGRMELPVLFAVRIIYPSTKRNLECFDRIFMINTLSLNHSSCCFTFLTVYNGSIIYVGVRHKRVKKPLKIILPPLLL